MSQVNPSSAPAPQTCNNRHSVSHSSGGWKPQVEVSAGLASPGVSPAASSVPLRLRIPDLSLWV